jgi:NAD(P)-dependent dehydrogenase (short-subunit alcohol dehydrogenase family)
VSAGGGAARRVLVTGGGTGIGAGITRAFLEAGDRVVIGQSTPEGAARALARLREDVPAARAQGRLQALGVDLSGAGACRRLVEEAVGLLGGLDVVVNNAAISGAPALAPLAETNDELLDLLVEVNLKAPFRITRHAAAHLPRGGVVVNIGSVGGFAAQEHAAAYCIAKGGLELLTRAAALELAERGIRVVGVAPGDIATERSDAAADRRVEAGISRYARVNPLGRQGTPAEVAAAVLFAASDGAGYVTGTTIVVDGGRLAY